MAAASQGQFVSPRAFQIQEAEPIRACSLGRRLFPSLAKREGVIFAGAYKGHRSLFGIF